MTCSQAHGAKQQSFHTGGTVETAPAIVGEQPSGYVLPHDVAEEIRRRHEHAMANETKIAVVVHCSHPAIVASMARNELARVLAKKAIRSGKL